MIESKTSRIPPYSKIHVSESFFPMFLLKLDSARSPNRATKPNRNPRNREVKIEKPIYVPIIQEVRRGAIMAPISPSIDLFGEIENIFLCFPKCFPITHPPPSEAQTTEKRYKSKRLPLGRPLIRRRWLRKNAI